MMLRESKVWFRTDDPTRDKNCNIRYLRVTTESDVIKVEIEGMDIIGHIQPISKGGHLQQPFEESNPNTAFWALYSWPKSINRQSNEHTYSHINCH
jgi:hypothetical protein